MVAPALTPEVPLPPRPAAVDTEAHPVQVRIGRIEIRARTPQTPVPPPPAPVTRGFDRYLRRRTYAREEY
jgi:hypothetical protein